MRKKLFHQKRSRVWLGGAITWYNYNLLNGPGVHWLHARPGGGPVLVEDASWRNINGILIRTRNSQTFLHFRRLPWDPRRRLR